MENKEERNSRKMVVTMAVAFVVIIAAFVAYYMGLIPGVGQGNKVAQELKAKVVASKGPNLKTNFLAYAEGNPKITDDQKNLIKNFADNADIDFEFGDVKTSSGDGKGTVEVDTPKLTVTLKGEGGGQSGAIAAPKLFISRDVKDANHTFYHTEGDIDVSANMGGTMSKIFSISGEQPYNEIKLNADGYTGLFKSETKNVKFIEGRGNTVVATIGDSSMEGNSTVSAAGQIDGYAKISEKNIVPGDMVKIMLGNIDPVSLNLDYAYKGDDYRPALQSLKQYNQQKRDDRLKAMLDPNYKPQPIEPNIKPIDGDLKLNDVSILMGNAGIVVNGDLVFKKSNTTALPFGTVNLKIAQYQKLIDYFSRFLKMPKEQIEQTIQMASELGTNQNGDISFTIALDGTENVKVNGKTADEVKAIVQKYMPVQPAPSAAPSAPVAVPPAKVEAKPIK